MSDAALKQFEQARKEQLDRNEARRMLALVNQARGDTHGAGARWPFELTQNAHDPGARDGKTGVDIDLLFDGETVSYEHDGNLFTMQDLAALLSGGSSKEFKSTETTGRFGTGRFTLTEGDSVPTILSAVRIRRAFFAALLSVPGSRVGFPASQRSYQRAVRSPPRA